MTIKEMGNKRNSKASKKKNKMKQIKCSCKEMVQYSEGDILHIGKIFYVTCDFCGQDIVLK